MRYTIADSPSNPGLFAVVRVAVGVATVECDGFESERRAREIASGLNAAYSQAEARRLATPTDPADRKIPKGFYTDADAS